MNGINRAMENNGGNMASVMGCRSFLKYSSGRAL